MTRTCSRLLVLLLPGLLATACATGRGARAQRTNEIFMEPLYLGLEPDQQLGLSDFDAGTLLHRGLEFQRGGDCQRAVPFYRRLLEQFPQSRYLSAAALNLGVCLEQLGDDRGAEQSYAIITERLVNSRDFVEAAFRRAACLARLQSRELAVELLERLLARPGLEVGDAIEARVLLAENLVMLERVVAAESQLRRALTRYRENMREQYLDPALAARAHFRLAELAEQRFRQAPLRLPEEQLEADLEIKAQRLLEAQGAYLRTIRQGDAHWATAAGWRIGNLYLRLHQDMQQVPLPDDLDDDEKQVYREMLLRRTAVLLKKALRVFEKTVQLAERTGIKAEWVEQARRLMVRLEHEVLVTEGVPGGSS